MTVPEKLTFQTHPLKEDIIKLWNEKQTNLQINAWLKTEHPTVVLSISTLCKHFNRYKANKERLESTNTEKPTQERKKKKRLPVEVILWETINQCRKMKKDASISMKDWQYLDQQLQSAIEKLIRLQDSTGEVKDISLILAEIFSKIESGEDVDVKSLSEKEISEEEKLKIIKEVDNEDKQKPDSKNDGASIQV